MGKSIFTREYGILAATLRQVRHEAAVTQVELAKKLGQTQSFVSKIERGELRLDLVQLRWICGLLGTSLPRFVAAFEKRVQEKK
jgi:transcriptional regulator with XRE-family HTH domain